LTIGARPLPGLGRWKRGVPDSLVSRLLEGRAMVEPAVLDLDPFGDDNFGKIQNVPIE
jgi:hypothetical protein